MTNRLISLGALLAFLAVALGAFGAHLLKGRIEANLFEAYHTAVLYHLVHALGVVACGILVRIEPRRKALAWSGYAMAMGVVFFSGSLYLMAVTGIRWLGAVTPLGGLLFLVAWLLLAATTLRKSE